VIRESWSMPSRAEDIAAISIEARCGDMVDEDEEYSAESL
jgi:hypothetical protein